MVPETNKIINQTVQGVEEVRRLVLKTNDMKIKRNANGGIEIDGEMNTFIFLHSGVNLFTQEGMDENDLLTRFTIIGANGKSFGSYWVFDNEIFRYIYDAGEDGLAFLRTSDNALVLAHEKDMVKQNPQLKTHN